MDKKNKALVLKFLLPAVVMFLMVFLYPILRTIIMSLFNVENITGEINTWKFAGIGNYVRLARTKLFRICFSNLFKIWFFGGIGVMCISLLFAVILNSGIRFKSFFRSMIYLPYTLSAVAVATMWIQYVYNNRFGLLTSFFSAMGWEKMSSFAWTSVEHKFGAMLFAYCFGVVGYYMVIFSSGIENIPQEYYEAARIDGCNVFTQFWYVTLPLIQGVMKTCLIMWSIASASFFVWSQLFSGSEISSNVATPVFYLVNMIFGGNTVVTDRDAGVGSAVGVIIGAFVALVFAVINRLIKDDGIEY